MDNILKLLLSVLGVAGLIAFVTSNLPYGEQPQVPAQPPVVVAGPPANQDANEVPPDEQIEESPEEDGDDVFAIGEPMIDGNPYGSPQGQQNQQTPFDQGQYGNFNYGPAPQGYAQPQVYAPQPSAGTFVPVNGGE
ncbi:MAG TPA: hypothetical protein VGN36_05570 [Sphingorhabdus sp.]|jgi:hypothetical protein|nr:hypothetical protein [Sphingorhabdus sp.]